MKKFYGQCGQEISQEIYGIKEYCNSCKKYHYFWSRKKDIR